MSLMVFLCRFFENKCYSFDEYRIYGIVFGHLSETLEHVSF